MLFDNKSLTTMSLDYSSSVAIVTLARPEARNAINHAFIEDFKTILTELAQDSNPARALLIIAEGKGFCAGADLKDQTGEMPPNLGPMLRQNYNPLIRQLKALPLPTIVAVNGAAAGAGMSLVCACDMAIAADDAYFLQAFVNIALVPDAGSTYFLPRLVGRARAASMMMLGEKLSAQDALDYGIISQVVTAQHLHAEALALAQKLAAMPTQAVIAIRHLLDGSEHNSLDQQLDAEADAQQMAGRSEDFMEGVTAFLQKRPAKFSGK
ncbi:enoyl-CoA hydratase-related protein [Paremcibacter congregatus]|uniref:enoyl-CoA hydratase-related protein n=1 Tax=Paremcibacter congregatus TaxID=2043170 RepID=UPI0030EF310A|tara:strand:- start:8227 stop:9027 length:801 start_codon:yes stop_codon:yes gene_type:complete